MNVVLRPKRGEMTGAWRKLHNEELSNLIFFAKYHWSDRVRENEMGRACSAHGEGFGGNP
jgi:hypothetical protein